MYFVIIWNTTLFVFVTTRNEIDCIALLINNNNNSNNNTNIYIYIRFQLDN